MALAASLKYLCKLKFITLLVYPIEFGKKICYILGVGKKTYNKYCGVLVLDPGIFPGLDPDPSKLHANPPSMLSSNILMAYCI